MATRDIVLSEPITEWSAPYWLSSQGSRQPASFADISADDGRTAFCDNSPIGGIWGTYAIPTLLTRIGYDERVFSIDVRAKAKRDTAYSANAVTLHLGNLMQTHSAPLTGSYATYTNAYLCPANGLASNQAFNHINIGYSIDLGWPAAGRAVIERYWVTWHIRDYAFQPTCTLPLVHSAVSAQGSRTGQKTDVSPVFSAVFGDANTLDESTQVDIQVTTDATFASVTAWNGSHVALTATCNKNDRCADIAYAGSTLTNGTTYYWRMRFYDSTGLVSGWSSGDFTVEERVPGIACLSLPNNSLHIAAQQGNVLKDYRAKTTQTPAQATPYSITSDTRDAPVGVIEVAGRIFCYFDRAGVAKVAISYRDGTEWRVADVGTVTEFATYTLKHVAQQGRTQYAVLYKSGALYYSRTTSGLTTGWSAPVQIVGSLDSEPAAWIVPQANGSVSCYYQLGSSTPTVLSCKRQDGGGSWS